MNTVKRSLSSKKLAKALNFSTETVYEYADAGLIPFNKTLNGDRLFNLEEVKESLITLNSSGVEGLRLPGELVADRLALGPKAIISASAKLKINLRATRTTLRNTDDN
jgi:hypothetical protein